jgi:hypothetical protein
MKRIIFLTVALLFVFSGFQNSFAKTYYRTFEVAEITSEGIILKDFEGGRFLIDKDPSGFNVGDSVRYDTVRNRLRKNPWQPAEIIKMTDRIITVKLKNGDKVDVNMRSKYRSEFNKGDQVHYHASKGQIKGLKLILPFSLIE